MKTTSKTVRKYVNILGVNIVSNPKDELLANIDDLISHNKRFSILTPNSELILASTTNPKLMEAFTKANINIPDTIGLSLAASFLSKDLPKTQLIKYLVGFYRGICVGLAMFGNSSSLTASLNPIKGRDLFMDLINLASQKKWKVFLLGGSDDEAEKAANAITKRYPSLVINTDKGPALNKNAEPISEGDRIKEADSITKINENSPDLLFVAFGNPKQEIWITENLKKLRIKGAMAVGGTFRYIAGMSPLPPKGLGERFEWLWRLITEPKRIKRIINASIVFPLRIFRFKVTGH